jgi:3-hydroxybutyrate dehydrogenase
VSVGIAGKVVLVTGATSGIGHAIARRFIEAGHQVVVHGLESEAEVCDIVSALGAGAAVAPHYEQADLALGEESHGLALRVLEKFGRIDILVNNAGIQRIAAVEDFPPDDWNRVIAISLDSAFHIIRASLPAMKANGWGRIINIASAHGLRASPYKSAYVATKHAVVGLTKTVALETAEDGVTANAICPGYVWTPLVATQVADQARVHKMSEEDVVRKIMLAPQPTKQFVQPEEIAELALYLSTDHARSITGSTISIDGGWTAK